MRAIKSAWLRVLALFGRTRRDAELADELDGHLQFHIDDNLRTGLAYDEARRLALLKLGGVDMTKETYRAQRGLPSIERSAREFRHAFERLRRSPGFTSATVLSLALAIGANVTIFAVVERIVLNPLPYPDSGQLISLDFGIPIRNIPSGMNTISTRMYLEYADHAHSLSGLTMSRTEDRTLTGQGTPERIRIARTTPSLPSVLRVSPVAGRWLTNDEGLPGAPPVAVLSNGLWQRRYGGDPGIVGRPVTLNGVPTIVVGVMPASFAFPDSRVDAWLAEPLSHATANDSYSYATVARLRDGAVMADVRAELRKLTLDLEARAPGNGYGAFVPTTLSLQDATVGPIAAALWILLGSAVALLLVACTNIANLFLVRSESRQREVGVRRALGAGTGDIVSYFVAESALLSLAGGLLGLAAAWYGTRLLVAFGPANLPRLNEIRLTPIELVFTLGVSAAAALVFGAVPLARLRLSRVSMVGSARGTTASRGTHRTRQLLMAGQVALALVLLVASGLLFRSFLRIRAIDPGFDPTSALTFQIGLPRADYAGRQKIVATHHAILDRLSALPGVAAASTTTCLPLSGRGFCGGAPLFVDGEVVRAPNAVPPIVAIRPVAESFFEAMGMRIVRGRGITRRDLDANEPVAVVNEALVRVGLANQDPIGKLIRLGPHTLVPGPPLWFTVIGVVKTTPTLALPDPSPVPKMYVPMFATRDVWPAVDVMTFVVHTSTPPLDLTPAVRGAVRAIDPNLALAQVRTLQDFLDAAAAPRAFTMVLIVIAASAALLLGVIGIYGVTSYIVSQRTSEIGVRLALGAQPATVMRMIVAQGGIVTFGGIAAGLAGALMGGRLIGSLLYGVSPRDPEVFAITTVSLFAVSLVACWLPARRAASVDPLVALRAD
jgi:putative ABC transport system permease protein